MSPAGWSAKELIAKVMLGEPLADETVARESRAHSSRVRTVPKPKDVPEFFRHPRLRRASPISRYLAAAGLEALGQTRSIAIREGRLRLGMVVVFSTGCVSYTRRFFEEMLDDPSLASPILFPETVFNAPASHLAALLGSTGINYTLLGDSAEFLSGLKLACDWLHTGECDGCLVLGAEESDWLIYEAIQLFTRDVVTASGAGALYLERKEHPGDGDIGISQITDPILYTDHEARKFAPAEMRTRLDLDATVEARTLLLDGLQDCVRLDAPERVAWENWGGPRLSIRRILGDALGASVAWQCVCARGLLLERNQSYDSAIVSAVGLNQQSIAAEFTLQPTGI